MRRRPGIILLQLNHTKTYTKKKKHHSTAILGHQFTKLVPRGVRNDLLTPLLCAKEKLRPLPNV